MSMKLYRRHRGLRPIRNNVYEDDEGRIVYKVHTPGPLKPMSGTTTISKAVPTSQATTSPPFLSENSNTVARSHGQFMENSNEDLEGDADSDSESDPGLVDEVDSGGASNSRPSTSTTSRRNSLSESVDFMYIAQIDWRVFKSSKIRFGIGHYSGMEVLAKNLFRKEGLEGRLLFFTGEDGKEYRWRLYKFHCELILNDGLKTPIAKYHRAHLFSKKKGYLEIFPQGQHMVDELFILFNYVDRVRKAKE